MNRRIRTIKPEIVQSESMGRVSRDARLLFILLWTQCDDEGRSRASPRMLASTLFPYDDCATSLITDWLRELEDEGCIELYAVGRDTYLQVKNWQKHQKIDRPTASRLPHPREGSRIFARARESSRGLASGSRGLAPDQDQDQYTHTSYESAPRSGVASQQSGNPEESGPAQATEPLPVDPPAKRAPQDDPAKRAAASGIWGAPVDYLTAHGVPEARARSHIGKWLKGRDPQSVVDAITTAQLNAAVDPISFVTKILSAGGSNGRIQGQYGRAGQSKHDAMAELKELQRELADRERGGRDGDAEIIDIGDYAAR